MAEEYFSFPFQRNGERFPCVSLCITGTCSVVSSSVTLAFGYLQTALEPFYQLPETAGGFLFDFIPTQMSGENKPAL